MSKAIVWLLRLYQRTISPDHGWLSRAGKKVCIFDPTCSDYTIQAIQTHGAVTGSWMGIRRIARCHPWSKGGADPIPQ